MKIVTVQIDDNAFERLQRDAKDPTFGYPTIGIRAVVIDGEWKLVIKEIK